ncbi:hypothetical protein [Sorangium sp. So ce1182]|uniref:hypothetical protein n=1 Tax=Sorangium sp. So ce1182 TaxID=3133334 RepID=UPI003F6105A7
MELALDAAMPMNEQMLAGFRFVKVLGFVDREGGFPRTGTCAASRRDALSISLEAERCVCVGGAQVPTFLIASFIVLRDAWGLMGFSP